MIYKMLVDLCDEIIATAAASDVVRAFLYVQWASFVQWVSRLH